MPASIEKYLEPLEVRPRTPGAAQLKNLRDSQVLEMIEVARAAGASAKFAGSGGAIVGTYEDEGMYERLCQAMAGIGCVVIKPQIGQGMWRPGAAA